MFRDESRGLIAKAQRQIPPKKTTTTTTTVTATTEIISTRPARPTNTDTREVNTCPPVGFQFAPGISVPVGLETPAEEQATTFFFQNYVPDRMSFPTGAFQYLEDIFSRENVGQAVKDAITALGIAGLSNFVSIIHPYFRISYLVLNSTNPYSVVEITQHFTQSSHQIYVIHEASKLAVNRRQRSKVQSNICSRDVIGSLRGLMPSQNDIETIVSLTNHKITNMCHKKESMDVWTRHTLGSSALMRFRGKKQLREPLGRELFLHHRSQVVSCNTQYFLKHLLTYSACQLHAKTCLHSTLYT